MTQGECNPSERTAFPPFGTLVKRFTLRTHICEMTGIGVSKRPWTARFSGFFPMETTPDSGRPVPQAFPSRRMKPM